MNNRNERAEIIRLLHEIREIAGSVFDTDDENILTYLSNREYFRLFGLLDAVEEECKRHKQAKNHVNTGGSNHD